jgi:hypothetical protein
MSHAASHAGVVKRANLSDDNKMTGYDDFIERLEGALEHEDGREDFMIYLQALTREQRAELLAEADRREPEAESN